MQKVDTILIESLKKEIKKITDDVSDLMWDRKMYSEFINIIKQNPRIDKPNFFYDFVKTGYVSHIILGICRQADKDEKALSLLNLLEKIFNSSEKITKDWFASPYKGPVLSEDHGRADFERHFGKLDFVDPSIVYADMGNLIFYTKGIRKYRDKRIAHFDKGEVTFDKDFSFATFDKAVEIIEELARKYYLLLHQAWMPDLLPTDTTDDYREIFYEPWIRQ
ncbi:MAG: hypothetical protein ABI758_07095 [Candidatus Woesebacteria bacterium]